MKTNILKKNAIIIFIISIIDISVCRSQFVKYKIKGEILSDIGTKELVIYKYINQMEQQWVGEINLDRKHFEFETSLYEVDSYMIKNPKNNHFFVFIWDNDIEIKIDTLEFSNSKILNSPLTDELQRFFENLEKKVFFEVRKVDSLILKYNRETIKNKPKLDSLYNLRTKSMEVAMKEHKNFYLSYINNNLDSFVSLYLLTKSEGMAFELNYFDFFLKFSDRLKTHSRAREFLGK
mgnify:CR=1 FL=1